MSRPNIRAVALSVPAFVFLIAIAFVSWYVVVGRSDTFHLPGT